MLEQQEVEGDRLERTTEMTVAGSRAMCFEYGALSKSSDSIIACNVDGRMVVNFFYRDPKLKADFYQILNGVR